MSPEICVVVPAYNASATIGQVVTASLKYVSKVIVFDDGSEDKTSGTASHAGAEVLRINKNSGKGNALKELFAKAIDDGYDAVITIDADGQHDPGDIPLFLKAHELHPRNIIVGSRMHEKGKIPRARYNSMMIARFFISCAANQFLEDTQCGFRLYPLGVVREMKLISEKYVTETELLIKAGDMGGEITFVEIKTIYGDNGSHFRTVPDVANITRFIISYLQVKWLTEALRPHQRNTYSKGRHIMDIMGKNRYLSFCFQSLTVITIFPLSLLFLLESILIPGSFASLRGREISFARAVFTWYLLPFILLDSIIEMILSRVGVRLKILDRIIERLFVSIKSPMGPKKFEQ